MKLSTTYIPDNVFCSRNVAPAIFGDDGECCAGEYRFGFNGQEKEPEINSSVTSAEYWMYDGRLGRRWNLDPKPNPSISHYSTFAGNPIMYSDPYGDTLRTDGSNASNQDIRSVAGAYSSLVKFDDKNKVSIDFSGAKDRFKTENGFDQTNFDVFKTKAMKDPGVMLLMKMSGSENNFFYANSIEQPFGIEYLESSGQLFSEPGFFNLNNYSKPGQVLEGTESYLAFHNLSHTPRGDENTLGYGQKPMSYDGEVYIAPGQFYTYGYSGLLTRIPRENFVFHELMENYLRVAGRPYESAHKTTIQFFNNSTNSYPFNTGSNGGVQYNLFIRDK